MELGLPKVKIHTEYTYNCVKCGKFCSGRSPYKLDIPVYIPEIQQILDYENGIKIDDPGDFFEIKDEEIFI